jgi:hypothetical protein
MNIYFDIRSYLNLGMLSQNEAILELLPTALEHNSLVNVSRDLKVVGNNS